jgi:hypothetical protein
MKNIHLIPTDKLSRLGRFIDTNNLFLRTTNDIPRGEDINIYITSDEEIKEGDWVYSETKNKVCKVTGVSKWSHKDDYSIDLDNENYYIHNSYGKKIILTTDQDLINDGVQAIDDEFLELFVKNSSCEEPKPRHQQIIDAVGGEDRFRKIAGIKPKQEKLEQAAEKWCEKHGCGYGGIISTAFEDGAKWQQERMYSEEEVIDLLQEMNDWPTIFDGRIDIIEWFNKFRKK